MAAASASDAKGTVEEYFQLFDEDNDGEVSVKQLGPLLRALGQIPSEAEVKELAVEIGSETFDLKDLQKILARRAKESDPEEDVREAFAVFDKDKKGVPVKDLRHAMKSVGEKITDAEFDELLKELNVPKDGKITVEQFLKVLPKK